MRDGGYVYYALQWRWMAEGPYNEPNAVPQPIKDREPVWRGCDPAEADPWDPKR